MAHVQFLSEQLETKEEILISIIRSASRINNIGTIYLIEGKEIEITKEYEDSDGHPVKENIWGISDCIDVYNDYLKCDEEERFIFLNLVNGKKLIPLFSADKVRYKKLLFEFAKEYLKPYPNNYLLIDGAHLYDLKRIEIQLSKE